jgi:glycosyltransferase involved in cell wall biosynthesis
MAAYDISVVVPTCRRDELLYRCLAALRAQTPGRPYEIIVVDDAAQSSTAALVRTAAEKQAVPAVRYIAVRDSRGPAAARNLGWRAAGGRIIAFTDDDCLPAAGWLREGLAAFSDGVSAVSGRIVVPLQKPPTDYAYDTAGLEKAEFATANCFYRREALEAAGGFDERFTHAWREDADLFFTLLEKKGKAVFCGDAIVVHPVRAAPWGISIRQQKKSMFNALLYKKHPELYREHIQRSPPWRYYAATGSLAAALAAALGGNARFSLLPASAWFLLSAAFCAARLQKTAKTPAHVTEMAVTSLLIPPLSLFWRMRGAIKFRVLFF